MMPGKKVAIIRMLTIAQRSAIVPLDAVDESGAAEPQLRTKRPELKRRATRKAMAQYLG